MAASSVYELKISDRTYAIWGYGSYQSFEIIAAQVARLIEAGDHANHYGNKPLMRSCSEVHSYGANLGDVVGAPLASYSGLQTRLISNRADYTRYYHLTDAVEFFDTVCQISSPALAALVLARNAGFGASVLVTQNVTSCLMVPNHKMKDKITFPQIVAQLIKWGVSFAFTIVEERWGVLDIPPQKINIPGYDVHPVRGLIWARDEVRTFCLDGKSIARYGGIDSEVNIMGGRICPKVKRALLLGEDSNGFLLLYLLFGTEVYQQIDGEIFSVFLSETTLSAEDRPRSRGLHSDRPIDIMPITNSRFVGNEVVVEFDPTLYELAHTIDNFDAVKQKADPYDRALMVKQNKRPFSSRAATKFAELDFMYNLVSGVNSLTEEIRVYHAGAAPGGSLEYFGERYGWEGQYLDYFKKGDCVFKGAVKSKVDNGVVKVIPGDGDLLKAENVQAVINCGPFNGFIADACAETFAGQLDKETSHYPMFRSEIVAALLSLANGGSMAIKFFGGHLGATAALILYTAQFFESTTIVKPHLSRPANSERFLVGRDFRAKLMTVDCKRFIQQMVLVWSLDSRCFLPIENELFQYAAVIRFFDQGQQAALKQIISVNEGDVDVTAMQVAHRLAVEMDAPGFFALGENEV